MLTENTFGIRICAVERITTILIHHTLAIAVCLCTSTPDYLLLLLATIGASQYRKAFASPICQNLPLSLGVSLARGLRQSETTVFAR